MWLLLFLCAKSRKFELKYVESEQKNGLFVRKLLLFKYNLKIRPL